MYDYDLIDAVDQRILLVLQDDARITNRDLAERVGLSPSACLARVRSLRERKIIVGFATQIDLSRLGRPLQALISIRLHSHARETLDRFVDDLLKLEETLDLFHVTGESDYLLHVAVADTEHLRDVVLDHLTVRSEVAQVTTSIMFDHHRPRARPLVNRQSDRRVR